MAHNLHSEKQKIMTTQAASGQPLAAFKRKFREVFSTILNSKTVSTFILLHLNALCIMTKIVDSLKIIEFRGIFNQRAAS
jgi:hypothetical protein